MSIEDPNEQPTNIPEERPGRLVEEPAVKPVVFNEDTIKSIKATGVFSLNPFISKLSPTVIRVAEQQLIGVINDGIELEKQIANSGPLKMKKDDEDQQSEALRNLTSNVIEQFRGGLKMIELSKENAVLAENFKKTFIGNVIRKRLVESFGKIELPREKGQITGLPIISEKMKVSVDLLPGEEDKSARLFDKNYRERIKSDDKSKQREVEIVFPESKPNEMASAKIGVMGEIVYRVKKEDGSEEEITLYHGDSTNEEKKRFLELFMEKMKQVGEDATHPLGENQKRYAQLEEERKELVKKYNRLIDPATVEEAVGAKRPQEMSDTK